MLHFCALGSDEMQKFVEDLKESIAEVTELEQIRIECKDAGAGLSETVGRGSLQTGNLDSRTITHSSPALLGSASPAHLLLPAPQHYHE